jgi:sodium transport system ATP-binding protein
VIELVDVKKRFGKRAQTVEALKGLSFRAADSEITGVLGPNGAGKTTSLRIAGALFLPDEGHAAVDGEETRTNPIAVRRRIGVLTHSAGIYPRLTPREHVRYAGRLHGMRDADIETRFGELIEMLDMREFADRRAEGFSQGQKLKTAIARALVHRPKNIILDEPTAGLDVKGTRAMRAIIRSLKDAGHCVVFSSHVMQEVAALCDRVVVLAHGKKTADGSLDELKQQTGKDTLEDAFIAAAGSDEGLQ